jgi:hypothetical protein
VEWYLISPCTDTLFSSQSSTKSPFFSSKKVIFKRLKVSDIDVKLWRNLQSHDVYEIFETAMNDNIHGYLN